MATPAGDSCSRHIFFSPGVNHILSFCCIFAFTLCVNLIRIRRLYPTMVKSRLRLIAMVSLIFSLVLSGWRLPGVANAIVTGLGCCCGCSLRSPSLASGSSAASLISSGPIGQSTRTGPAVQKPLTYPANHEEWIDNSSALLPKQRIDL